MSRFPSLREEHGFSLLEVIIAVAILAFISALVWYSFAQVFKTIDVVRADSDMLRMARQVTSRIPEEMSEAYLPDNFASPAVTVKYEFVAEDRGDLDRVRFQAFAHTKYYQDANESDEAELEYWTEPDPAHSGLSRLMRREDVTLDDRPDEGGSTVVMADKIKTFDLQYYDSNRDQWFDSWDTNRTDTGGRLPYAMRLKVVFVDTDKREHVFLTSSTIRLAKAQEQR